MEENELDRLLDSNFDLKIGGNYKKTEVLLQDQENIPNQIRSGFSLIEQKR